MPIFMILFYSHRHRVLYLRVELLEYVIGLCTCIDVDCMHVVGIRS